MRISLEQAASKLKQGELVAIPTETVYGLAADASNDLALAKIFSAKQRPADHPLIVHISDMAQVQNWASVFPDTAVKLAKAFWPGPLTLILPAQTHVSKVVRGGESTIALRVPNHPLALALLKLSQLSVAAPSANLFTQLSPTTAAHVEAGLGSSMPVLDGGACQVGIESSIVSVSADGTWNLLRPGMISEADISRVVGQPQQTLGNNSALAAPTPKAPGQHDLHYSPRTAMALFKDRASLILASEHLQQSGLSCAALIMGPGAQPDCHTVVLNSVPAEVAEKLYGTLHALDDLKPDRLLIELPPETAEWTAVLDRLTRAGHTKDS
ncbi:MAG: threonylcarbamoyl-AMP synthase [Methylotenera sp.]|nr:threonylcarbamoyl-AMP synthase [Methylotenera sp.]